MLPYKPSGDRPTYDLQEVQRLVGQGGVSCVITNAALDGAAEEGLDRQEIIEAVLSLDESHFYKSMGSNRFPSLWQDVYHLLFGGCDLYIKLQIDTGGFAVVIQCKRK
jgi:Motility quorum-sensing regulator, toxin of MqsA